MAASGPVSYTHLEYKNVREHLLANLEGDRAWRYDRSTYECLNRNHRAEDAR